MKAIPYSLLRTICALIIGLVLVLWPGSAADYLVITIGVLFIVPGLLGILGYFMASKEEGPVHFPIVALGSFLFGLWLVIMPGFFINILMYVLGFVLLLGGVQQLYMLIAARKWMVVPVPFYITPVLILLAALFILLSPRESQQTIFIVIGAASIVYAVAELLHHFKFMNKKPKYPAKREVVDAEVIEE